MDDQRDEVRILGVGTWDCGWKSLEFEGQNSQQEAEQGPSPPNQMTLTKGKEGN